MLERENTAAAAAMGFVESLGECSEAACDPRGAMSESRARHAVDPRPGASGVTPFEQPETSRAGSDEELLVTGRLTDGEKAERGAGRPALEVEALVGAERGR